MANVKKINGYDLIDSKCIKYTGNIEDMELDSWNNWGSIQNNYVNITLPTGWNINDVFIIGGYYEITDPNNSSFRVKENLGEQFDINGNIKSIAYLDYVLMTNPTEDNIRFVFFNLANEYVNKNLSFSLLIYNKA